MTTLTILLIGCGNMGRGLLEGWIRHDHDTAFLVVDPALTDNRLHRLQNMAEARGVTVQAYPTLAALSDQCLPDAVVLAVKPQLMGSVLPACARYIHGQKAPLISIAAGISMRALAQGVAQPVHDAALVRAMPNLAVSVGQGATLAIATPATSVAHRALAERLLAVGGLFAWTTDEGHMDAVTALSGSGSAYVFALIEAMARAGCALGLSPEIATAFARQTLIGSAALVAENKTQTVAALRESITSPQGTTAAALAVLGKAHGLEDLVQHAMRAAADRARELSQVHGV